VLHPALRCRNVWEGGSVLLRDPFCVALGRGFGVEGVRVEGPSRGASVALSRRFSKSRQPSHRGEELVNQVVARIKLNGKDLGVVWCHPWRLAVSSALKKGKNELEIEVVNLWPNRLIGDGQAPPERRLTRTNVPHYYGLDPKTSLRPSGLLGPVRIMAEE